VGRSALVLAGAALAGIMICAQSEAADARGAAAPRSSAEKRAEAANPVREQHGILAKARRALLENKVEECLAALEELDGGAPLQIRLEGKFLAARALWESGSPKDVKQSQKLLEQLSREMQDWKPGPVRLAIAKALQLDEDDKAPEAIRTLEAAIARGVKHTATAEAQIELARLLASAGRVEEARKQLDAADALLKRETKVEMYAEEAAPYFAWIEKTRKGLKYDANPGLAEVEEADKLRKAGKFADAGKLYQRIIATWPAAESADRAQVGLGWCILARRVQVIGFAGSASYDLSAAHPQDVAAAVAHWQKFITAKPQGRWRGQAFVALLSLAMDGRLGGEEAGKAVQLAATSIPGALADEKSKASWQACLYELRLKVGTLAWVQNRPGEAAEQLGECAKLAGGERGERLAAAVECIKAGRALVPEEVAAPNSGTVKPKVPTDRAGLVLSVALIQALAGETETARELLSLVTQQKLPVTQNQFAFAQFLQVSMGEGAEGAAAGRASEANQKPRSEPGASYAKLLKDYPQASWNDEILYRLATESDTTAAAATDDDPLKLKQAFTQKSENGSGVPPLKQSASVKNQNSEIKNGTDGAVYYRDLALNYRQSPRRERALWRYGRISLDAGEADAADQAFTAQLHSYPQGPYAGDAYVRLIDNALEYRFDLQQAKKAADVAVAWASSNENQNSKTESELEPWRLLAKTPSLPVPEWVKYEVYLRAGMIAYAEEDLPQALSLFEAAGTRAVTKTTRDATLAEISLQVLKTGCKRKVIPWDVRALAACKTDAQQLAIKLADLYVYGARSERALGIYRRFEAGDPLLMPAPADVQAYCLWRLALSYAQSGTDNQKALALYRRFYEPGLSRSLFAPEAVLRYCVLSFNTSRDHAKALKDYGYFLEHYPDHPGAESAMYFYCIHAIELKNVVLARKSAEEFCRRYANSPNDNWRQDVREELRKLELAVAAESKTAKENR
jgi:predicted nucleic acid-binding protein